MRTQNKDHVKNEIEELWDLLIGCKFELAGAATGLLVLAILIIIDQIVLK